MRAPKHAKYYTSTQNINYVQILIIFDMIIGIIRYLLLLMIKNFVIVGSALSYPCCSFPSCSFLLLLELSFSIILLFPYISVTLPTVDVVE